MHRIQIRLVWDGEIKSRQQNVFSAAGAGAAAAAAKLTTFAAGAAASNLTTFAADAANLIELFTCWIHWIVLEDTYLLVIYIF